MEQSQDFWARSEDIPAEWPKTADGGPEPAAHLSVQWELDGMADITLSFLRSCGIPAFKSGTLGKVLFGFAGQGVDLYVPRSCLEEAQALLAQPVSPEDGSDPL